MRMVAAIFLAALVTGTDVTVAQQPALAPGSGPTVLYDFGQNHLPIVERVTAWLRADGYVTEMLTGPFNEQALDGVDIVITWSPMADLCALPEVRELDRDRARDVIAQFTREVMRRPISSAFSVEEIDTLQAWVERGGGLCLVFDHFPPGSTRTIERRSRINRRANASGRCVDSSPPRTRSGFSRYTDSCRTSPVSAVTCSERFTTGR